MKYKKAESQENVLKSRFHSLFLGQEVAERKNDPPEGVPDGVVLRVDPRLEGRDRPEGRRASEFHGRLLSLRQVFPSECLALLPHDPCQDAPAEPQSFLHGRESCNVGINGMELIKRKKDFDNVISDFFWFCHRQ